MSQLKFEGNGNDNGNGNGNGNGKGNGSKCKIGAICNSIVYANKLKKDYPPGLYYLILEKGYRKVKNI